MIFTIENEYLQVSVQDKGAELYSVLGANGTEYLWQGDPQYWSGRAYNIFPYVARLTQGCYELDGRLYHMAIHGIARYRVFRPVAQEKTRLVLELAADEDTLAIYPRNFVFRVCYELVGNQLVQTYQVENRDERTLYFGLGGHPGFNVPGNFRDYRFRFQPECAPKRVGFNDDCFTTGELTDYPLEEGRFLNLRHDLFDRDVIVLKGMSSKVVLESTTSDYRVEVTYPGMQYLGLWHKPKTDAPFVCIEPWCSLPARENTRTVFEEQEDLISLAPGKVYENRWTMTFSGTPNT